MKFLSLFSSYGAILIHVAAHPRATGLEISTVVDVQERTARRNIAIMVANGYLTKERVDRVNRYEVNSAKTLPRSMLGEVTVGDLMKLLLPLLG